MRQYGDCSFCGGEVKEKLIELDYRYKGKLYVFRNVPVGVCQQCGEKYLKAEVAKSIEKDIKHRQKWDETIEVPVRIFRQVTT
ncbi:MAG: type II toxin-antitoxin system MqsA family antitoxin [Ignavibacteriaceae bacterium]|jgi:YgiT-type zinc finger domain-containing protein|nr:type II toxin-antitoxin system MqsA family antitoxin [Ignavibacteriaceae bacterium]